MRINLTQMSSLHEIKQTIQLNEINLREQTSLLKDCMTESIQIKATVCPYD